MLIRYTNAWMMSRAASSTSDWWAGATAATEQLTSYALNAVDQKRLERQAKAMERQMEQVESELDNLG